MFYDSVMYKDIMEWSHKVLRYGIVYFRHSATIFGIVSFISNF